LPHPVMFPAAELLVWTVRHARVSALYVCLCCAGGLLRAVTLLMHVVCRHKKACKCLV